MECAFEVLHYKVESESDLKNQTPSEATVKIKIGQNYEHKVAEGNGPINALDTAIRKALNPYFPKLKDITLKDFWVRIKDGSAGTASSVEVMIISSDGIKEWITKAVSTDVIKASAEALMQSFKKAIANGNK
ncbi:MAG: hypothetical protein HYT36_03795 [Candidatus Staskawiczbacteria bacterium]|nr:hypothetical protein [Candidatus Staskawiczbacteria bacterium]